jgi:hypothetical protein
MNDIEVFEIEERFNPLEDQRFAEDELEQESDYLPPVPDAELGQRTAPVRRTPRERIESLIVGIPGQRFRILHAVRFCDEPHTRDEIAAELDAAYPGEVSVYNSTQIVQLLEHAGALAKQTPVAEDTADAERDGAAGTAADAAGTTAAAAAAATDAAPGTAAESDFLVVTQTPPSTYLATPVGLEAVEEAFGTAAALAMLAEEERYLPLYQEILVRAAVEGGCSTKALDDFIDPHPLAEEPRRFCGYFLGRLEKVGAVRWLDNWIITEPGRAVLRSPVFEG